MNDYTMFFLRAQFLLCLSKSCIVFLIMLHEDRHFIPSGDRLVMWNCNKSFTFVFNHNAQ